MARRKKKKNIWTYITSIIVVIIIILFWFLSYKKVITVKFTKTTNETKNKIVNNNTYYKNSIITWNVKIIEIPYNIKIWTNYKVKLNNKEFYVKSDKYNLANYTDKNIDIKGEIIWFSSENIPVLSIKDVKEDKQETEWNSDSNLTWENLSWGNINKINDNKELLYKWISINLENTEYNVKEESWNVFIYKNLPSITWENLSWNELTWEINTWNNLIIEKYIEITPFKCEKWSNLYDCDNLKKQFILYKFSKFTNNNWISFYKLPESNQYTILSKEYWYNLTPLKWNIYNISQYINIEDTSKLKNQLILNTCKNKDIQLTQILNIENSWDNYIVKWFDKNSNKIECNITIKWENTLIWKLNKIKIIQNDIKSSKLDESKYLKYKSRAFLYTLYMPKNIKYKVILSKEDFWVAWLSCKQKVNIADWKYGNLKSPDVEVYYCKTDLSKDEIDWFLKRKQISYIIKQVSWKTFIIKYTPWSISEKILKNIKIY